ncbi:MAG: zinc ribbon domain-containing protein [Pseudomonadaceae bacterium]|jgi:predicted amidophosphoribosyltransferase
MPNLNIVICPGCGSELPADNRGCTECGYENNEDGRLLSIAEMLERPSYPAPGAMRLNDVCPAFIKAIVAAAQAA